MYNDKLLITITKISPSIGLTNLAKPYHVHYHLSQPDMAGGARRVASVQRFALLADVRGNKACSNKDLNFRYITYDRVCVSLRDEYQRSNL